MLREEGLFLLERFRPRAELGRRAAEFLLVCQRGNALVLLEGLCGVFEEFLGAEGQPHDVHVDFFRVGAGIWVGGLLLRLVCFDRVDMHRLLQIDVIALEVVGINLCLTVGRHTATDLWAGVLLLDLLRVRRFLLRTFFRFLEQPIRGDRPLVHETLFSLCSRVLSLGLDNLIQLGIFLVLASRLLLERLFRNVLLENLLVQLGFGLQCLQHQSCLRIELAGVDFLKDVRDLVPFMDFFAFY